MYYFVISGLELLKLYLIFRFGFEIPKRKISKIGKNGDISTIVFILVWLTVSIIMFINPKTEDSFLFYISWVLIEVILLCQYEIFKLLLLAGCAMFLIGTIDSILFMGFNIVMKLMDLTVGLIINVGASGITLVLLVIAIFYIPRKNNGRLKQVGIKYLVLVLLVSFLNSLVTSLLWIFISDEEFGKNSIKLGIVFVLIFCSVFFQIGLLLKLAISNNLYEEKHQMNRYYLDLQEKHYLYLEQKENETKKFRHDIKNHMYMIDNLCKEEEFEKLSDYIEGVWGKIENISGGIHVNNGVVEAILNQYDSICKSKNIKLKIKGSFPTKCFIDLFDLCTIFSNIMQNAYEAADKCARGEIHLTIRYDDAGIYIQEKNSCIKDGRIREERLKTNKKDHGNHGFGILNIQECVKNYNGTFTYDVEENTEEEYWFTIKIVVFHKKKD